MTSTEIGVFSGFAAELGGAFEAAQGGGRKLYGYAEHSLNGTFLGTSTGLRLRHDQPSGKVEMNAKSADLARSAWAGCGTKDFTDVDVASLDAGLQQRLDWARRKIDLPPGRYETLLPPAPWPTCSSTCTGQPGPRTRWTAAACSASRAAAPGSASGWPASR